MDHVFFYRNLHRQSPVFSPPATSEGRTLALVYPIVHPVFVFRFFSDFVPFIGVVLVFLYTILEEWVPDSIFLPYIIPSNE